MAPTFVQAGTGITVTGTSGTASLTGCTLGNVIVVHAVTNPNADFATYSSITNIENLAGTDNALTEAVVGAHYNCGSPVTGKQVIHWGRVMANGTCSVDINVSTDDAYCRLYEFTGVIASATTYETLSENTEGNPVQAALTNSSVSPGSPSLTTTGTDRLALAFVAVTDDTAIAEFTGETGGNWTEAVDEYTSASGTQGCIQLQTAAMASAGTMSGGSTTIGASAGYSVVTLALLPETAPPAGVTLRTVRSSMRW